MLSLDKDHLMTDDNDSQQATKISTKFTLTQSPRPNKRAGVLIDEKQTKAFNADVLKSLIGRKMQKNKTFYEMKVQNNTHSVYVNTLPGHHSVSPNLKPHFSQAALSPNSKQMMQVSMDVSKLRYSNLNGGGHLTTTNQRQVSSNKRFSDFNSNAAQVNSIAVNKKIKPNNK